MTSIEERIQAFKARYQSCFGCGMENPLGLQLDGFTEHDGTIRVRWRPRTEYQGFSGMLHGGIVTAALDEVMAWTAMLQADVAVVTGRLELRFRKPAAVAVDYTVEGRVEERRGRRILMAASLLDDTEKVVAEADAMFLVAEELGAG